MAHAYTPGLKVSAVTVIRKVRRLPIPGQVLVSVGDRVDFDTVVARADLPGNPQTFKMAYKLGVDPDDVPRVMLKKEGEAIRQGEVIARTSSFFGLIKREVTAPCDGVVERISAVTGQVTLREPPIPVQVAAYVAGTVAEVLGAEGAVIETRGAFIQGIFGVGGERFGEIAVAVADPGEVLDVHQLSPEHAGKVVVGGSLVTRGALEKAGELGVRALVVGGIIDTDLAAWCGYEIGVAITGQEDVPFTLIVTEGFGRIRMADRTFNLLRRLAGRTAAVNGATQIRAGVMRPEIIVPGYEDAGGGHEGPAGGELAPGTPVRIIREPYFGLLGEVVELPPEPVEIETEARVRVLRVRLQDGSSVTVPRANVEIIEA